MRTIQAGLHAKAIFFEACYKVFDCRCFDFVNINKLAGINNFLCSTVCGIGVSFGTALMQQIVFEVFYMLTKRLLSVSFKTIKYTGAFQFDLAFYLSF